MKKNIFLLLLLALFSFNSFEDDFIDSLKLKFDAYLKSVPVGDLYVSFNQSKYIAGDTVAMSIQYSRNLDKSPVKQIVYLQLLNDKGVESWHAKALLKKGKAITYFILSPEIKTGAYTFIAFTEQIRQTNPNLAFTLPFYVSDKTLVKATNDEPAIKIYSECGISVSGLVNHFVLNGPALSQIRIKNKNSIIQEIRLDSAGFANVTITPAIDDSLSVEMESMKNILFPKREIEGIQMHVEAAEQTVAISSTEKLQTSGKKVYFIVAGNRGITFSKELNIKEKQNLKFSIPDESLQDGLCQALLIDSDYKIWAKQNFHFKKQKTAIVSILSDAKILKTDQIIELKINITDSQENALRSLANVNIANSILLDPVDRPVSSENLFRLNQKAVVSDQSPFNWDKILNLVNTKLPEDKLYLRGKITHADTNQPVGDSTHVLFFLKKSLLGYDTYTNAKGEFKAPLIFDFYGEEELFYCAVYKGRDLTNIIFQFDESFPTLNPNKIQNTSSLNVADPYYHYSVKKKLIENSYSFFQKKTNDEDVDYNTVIEDELQGADIIFKTADYVLFPTMAELVKEALKSVDHRVIKGRDIVRLYTTNDIPNRQTSPLFVIDGAVSKDPKQFLSLNPENVVTIKLVKDSKKLLRFGALSKYGVILVKTKSGQHKPEALKTLEGFLPTYEIKEPKRSNHRIPDLRASLLWKPQLIIGDEPAQLTITTSNDIGDFFIEVKGFTTNGIPFYHREPFKVIYQTSR